MKNAQAENNQAGHSRVCKLRPSLAVPSNGERPVSERKWWEPEPRLQWEVFAVDKKGKPIEAPVYVVAPTYERALARGKYWRRVLSRKKAKMVVAQRYYPERDRSLPASGYVKLTPND